MKWVLLLSLIFLNPLRAGAFSSEPFVQQVLQRDVFRSLQWMERLSQASQLSQVEIYELYRSALPEIQDNNHVGISIKGSVERIILLLEGTRYFTQVQKTSVEYQENKEALLKVLQSIKDEMDRFEFGEDPQTLLEEWQSLGITDIKKFTSDMVEIFLLLEKLLKESNDGTDSKSLNTNMERVESEDFEKLRFESYIGSVESGKVAEECQGVLLWKTDQAASCDSDDSLECDRSYARQCKRL